MKKIDKFLSRKELMKRFAKNGIELKSYAALNVYIDKLGIKKYKLGKGKFLESDFEKKLEIFKNK